MGQQMAISSSPSSTSCSPPPQLHPALAAAAKMLSFCSSQHALLSVRRRGSADELGRRVPGGRRHTLHRRRYHRHAAASARHCRAVPHGRARTELRPSSVRCVPRAAAAMSAPSGVVLQEQRGPLCGCEQLLKWKLRRLNRRRSRLRRTPLHGRSWMHHGIMAWEQEAEEAHSHHCAWLSAYGQLWTSFVVRTAWP